MLPALPTATNCPLNAIAFMLLVEIGACSVQTSPSGLVSTVPAAPIATKTLVVVVVAVAPVPVVATNVPRATPLRSLIVLTATACQAAPSVLVTTVPCAPTATYLPLP